MAKPEEIANGVLFLPSSRAASFLYGTNLNVDGGTQMGTSGAARVTAGPGAIDTEPGGGLRSDHVSGQEAVHALRGDRRH
jgi:hypothetical protein